jgi:hypothetical protein
MVQLTLLAELLAHTQTVCLSYARTISGRVRERVAQGTRQASVQMALGSHRLVLRVRTGTGRPSTLGTVTDYQPSAAPTYGRLPGLTMLRVYPVNCGNKPRVWTHLTALLELEVILQQGVVEINMIANDGLPFKANLHGVIYIPGLKRRQFSVTAFASRVHYAIVKRIVPENVKQQSQKKRIDLELAHARFVRPSRALLSASSAEVWNDLTIRMSPDSDCISCRISTIKARAVRIYQHLSRSTYMARANGYIAGGSAPQTDKDRTARPGLAGILHTMHPA